MVAEATRPVLKAAHDMLFRHVHNSNLIYNCAWEDPRIDRRLLKLDSTSQVVMITSAGCNALDYLLDDPAAVYAIDVNYRQNALLELKMALIARGDFSDLFEMFGVGCHRFHRTLYQSVRRGLSEPARMFWDRRIGFFNPESLKRSFYYHGTAGIAAWVMGNALFRLKPNIRHYALALLEAHTLDEQRAAWSMIEREVWNGFIDWLVRQPALMALLGVPRPQIKLIENSHAGGLSGYVKDKLRHVLTELPVSDNYFWRVYITGSYSPECCPNYLKQEHQHTLRERLGRLKPCTTSVSGFLREHPGQYSHFVLLDHQDWLAAHDAVALREEWELIFANSRPGAKVLMRSAGLNVDFIPEDIRTRMRFDTSLTRELHTHDRVGTYGSTHFAEILS